MPTALDRAQQLRGPISPACQENPIPRPARRYRSSSFNGSHIAAVATIWPVAASTSAARICRSGNRHKPAQRLSHASSASNKPAEVDGAYVSQVMQAGQATGELYLVTTEDTGWMAIQEFGQDVPALTKALGNLIGQPVRVNVFHGRRWLIQKPPDRYLDSPYGVRVPIFSPTHKQTPKEQGAYMAAEPVQLPAATAGPGRQRHPGRRL